MGESVKAAYLGRSESPISDSAPGRQVPRPLNATVPPMMCGAGSGEGVAPGASSWVTLTLAPGRYELVCNFPGHYAAGMYTQLTVR